MQNRIFVTVALTATLAVGFQSCNPADPRLKDLSRFTQENFREIRQEISTAKILTFRKDRRGQLKLLLALIQGGVKPTAKNLKDGGTDSAQKSRLQALRTQFEIFKNELSYSSMGDGSLARIQELLGQTELAIEAAETQYAKVPYDSVPKSAAYRDFLDRLIQAEQMQVTQLGVAQKDLNRSRSKLNRKEEIRLETLNRTLELRNRYYDTLVSEKNAPTRTISDEVWGTLRSYAKLSGYMNDLVVETLATDLGPSAGLPQPVIDAVENEGDEKCKFKMIVGDEPGTQSGTATSPNPKPSNLPAASVKCKVGSEPIIPLPSTTVK
ncbi:MAG: hypothetical protein JNL01_15360 [Bdellovibrionales bacterium]|nr:hypothetical protein [Bdellovibrionales bacterium]